MYENVKTFLLTARQAEVRNPGLQSVLGGASDDDDVSRFDVSVHYSLAVHVVQPARGAEQKPAR